LTHIKNRNPSSPTTTKKSASRTTETAQKNEIIERKTEAAATVAISMVVAKSVKRDEFPFHYRKHASRRHKCTTND
jgi:hypothetical protein